MVFDPMKTRRLLLLSAALATFQASCVVGTREISIDVPQGQHPGGRGGARIASVTDSRQFQNHPSEPSTPSIDGDVNSKTRAELGRYVGRQRNTYGAGMGDIALAGSGTVPAKAGEIVGEALARKGYRIGGSGTPVNVEVRKFWAWMSPGMWAITLEARIETVVSVGGRRIHAEGYGENVCQAATNDNWELAYRRAVDDLLAKLESRL